THIEGAPKCTHGVDSAWPPSARLEAADPHSQSCDHRSPLKQKIPPIRCMTGGAGACPLDAGLNCMLVQSTPHAAAGDELHKTIQEQSELLFLSKIAARRKKIKQNRCGLHRGHRWFRQEKNCSVTPLTCI
uniref:Uncharacterized protein n=1 Tax=Triticum urartu TaxID=4572 RepID=A0A8R7THZ6_TRIUA